MKQFKRLTAIMLAIIVTLTLSVTAMAAGDANEAVNEARRGVLQINLLYVDQNGNEHEDGRWHAECSDNLYISQESVLKKQMLEIHNGAKFTLCYSESGGEIFRIEVIYNFDQITDFDCYFAYPGKGTLSIGGSSGCDLCIRDEIVGNSYITISRNNGLYTVDSSNSTLGVYLNGTRHMGVVTAQDYDFVMLGGYTFFLKEGYVYTHRSDQVDYRDIHVMDIQPQKHEYRYPKFNRTTRVTYKVPEEKIEVLDPEKPVEPKKDSQSEDFLTIRYGSGVVESCNPISYKPQEFANLDPLAYYPEQLAQNYKYLAGAPVVTNLKEKGSIGIVGSSAAQDDFLRAILLDLVIQPFLPGSEADLYRAGTGTAPFLAEMAEKQCGRKVRQADEHYRRGQQERHSGFHLYGADPAGDAISPLCCGGAGHVRDREPSDSQLP